MMKWMLFFFIFIPFWSNSQTLGSKKISTSCFREIYFVDKSTKQKCGKYLKLDRRTKDTLVSGEYKNDQKTSIWKYYADENKLWMAYNFDNKSLVLRPKKMVETETFSVFNGNTFSEQNVDNPPFYLGSKNEIEKIFLASIKLSSEITANSKSGICIARFIVTKDGKIRDIVQELVISNDLAPQIKNILESMQGDWIPAKVNKEAVDAQYMLVLDIKPGGNPSFEDNPKCIVVHLNYLKPPTTKRVVGYEIRQVDAQELMDSGLKISRSKRIFQ
jgi:hypothetical protein